MADPPQVSVVIPAYNAARTVEASIRSALEQTLSDLEVIVVDDGSSDATKQVAEGVGDPRVQVLGQPNAGAAAARNTGIRAARGRYVALLDSDDIWLPHKLERQLAVMAADPAVHAVQSGAFFVDDDMRVLYERRCRPPVDALLETLRFQNIPCFLSTLVVERTKFDEMGAFDETLEILEEWDMAIKASWHCNMASVEEPLALYRVHPGNRSRNLGIHIAPGFAVLDRVFSDPALPAHVRERKREIHARFYTMLAGGAFRNHEWARLAKWGTKALLTDPGMVGYMAALPARRLSRLASKRREAQRAPARGTS